LKPEAVAGLKLAQAKNWTPAQFAALTPEAAAALPKSVIKGLSARQKAAIPQP
jgi:hypothetical protein